MASDYQEDKTISVVPLLIDPMGRLITENVTFLKLATSTDYVAGRLLGKITASGKVVDYDPTKTDGSENIYGILGNDVTVGTEADTVGSFVYLKGLFNQNRITAKTGVVIADTKDELRKLGIYLANVVNEQ